MHLGPTDEGTASGQDRRDGMGHHPSHAVDNERRFEDSPQNELTTHLLKEKIALLRYQKHTLIPYLDYPEVRDEASKLERSLALCFQDLNWLKTHG